MKFSVIFLMISVLAVMFATPYLLPLISSDFSDVTISGSSEPSTSHYYKWQDAEGNWQFSDDAPEGIASDSVDVDTRANILEPFLGNTSPKPEQAKPAKPAVNLPTSPLVMPSQAKQLIEDAKNIDQLLENRQQELDKRMNSL